MPAGLKNTARSCSQHGVVADGLNSERPGSVIPVSKNIYCTGSIFIASVTVNVSETDIRGVVVHAQCFPPYQISFVPSGPTIR